MSFLNTWLQGIVVSVIIASIIEMIIPNGNNKKYIKMLLGVYIVFNIITPIINKISKNDFELSSIINIEKYTKDMQTYQTNSKSINLEENNEKNIKQIYISNLKSDMKAKLEEKDYKVNNIEILLEENEEYQINSITLYLENKEKNENDKDNENNESNKNNSSKNIANINQIETINIQIDNNTYEKTNAQKSNITEVEKKEIIKYIASVYEIKEKQINIY